MNQPSDPRLVSLTPLAAGWRALYAQYPPEEIELASLPDPELFWIYPIACLALVEVWREGVVEQEIRVITGGDGRSFRCEWEENSNVDPIVILGPGEEITARVREDVISHIKQARARILFAQLRDLEVEP